jgi:pyruvate/2-oxoglutarate dehydrogenase complex dihydrolipoamide acyltransferase (E2) component
MKVTWSAREPFENRAKARSTEKGGELVTERQTEALEKLNQGIQESRREVQQRTMNLAQEYFGDSAEVLKQNIRENRATLEGLPDQIPGGREEAFQTFFQELMGNYSSMEECINEAQQNVANLDTDQIRRQGEIEATDAARREAQERGVDLTKVEGTGSEGRIIVSDVVVAAEAIEEEDGAACQAAQQAQDAAGLAACQAQLVAGE